MRGAGVMVLLRPLLLDAVPSIQQTAALALGRLANYSPDLAEDIVQHEILPQLVSSLGEQNVYLYFAIISFSYYGSASFECSYFSLSTTPISPLFFFLLILSPFLFRI